MIDVQQPGHSNSPTCRVGYSNHALHIQTALHVGRCTQRGLNIYQGQAEMTRLGGDRVCSVQIQVQSRAEQGVYTSRVQSTEYMYVLYLPGVNRGVN